MYTQKQQQIKIDIPWDTVPLKMILHVFYRDFLLHYMYTNKTESQKSPKAILGVELKYPENGWSLRTLGLQQLDSLHDFNMSHIVNYFVTRTVKDCLPAGDFISMNRSAENLFKCGHVQNIQSVRVDGILYLKSNCLLEKRKIKFMV